MPNPGSDPRPLSRQPDRVLACIVAACGVVAALIRIPTVLATRHLSFDDGVYGASAIAMRAGGTPFRSVFSSQGPAFLPLVALGDLIGGHQAWSPRTLAVIAGVVTTISVAMIAANLANPARRRAAAAIAGVVCASSGALWWTTGPLTSDGPTIALGCAALWIATHARMRPRRWQPWACGVLLGCAVAIKLVLAFPACVVCAILLWTPPLRRTLVALVVPIGAIPLAATATFGIGRVWNQVVTYHLTTSVGSRNPLVHLAKLCSTLADRDVLLLVMAGAGLVALIVAARQPSTDSQTAHTSARHNWMMRVCTWSASDIGCVVVWLAVTIVILSVQQPLWRNHVAYIVPPLAVLAGIGAATSTRSTVICAVLLAAISPVQVVRTSALWRPGHYQGNNAAIINALRDLPTGRKAISDDPGLVWRAGASGNSLRTPDNFVDTSVLRITSPEPSIVIDSATIVNAIERDPTICVVVQTSKDRFGRLRNLDATLLARGWTAERYPASNETLWRNPGPRCSTPSSA